MSLAVIRGTPTPSQHGPTQCSYHITFWWTHLLLLQLSVTEGFCKGIRAVHDTGHAMQQNQVLSRTSNSCLNSASSTRALTFLTTSVRVSRSRSCSAAGIGSESAVPSELRLPTWCSASSPVGSTHPLAGQ